MWVEFHGLQFDLPAGWADITDDLDDRTLPTLARPDGIGAIQFSIGRYVGGENPRVSLPDLRRQLSEFAQRHSLEFESQMEREHEISFTAGVATADGQLIAAWLLTNGLDIVIQTYTGMAADQAAPLELADARRVAETIKF